jgi:hypothetical protein
MSTSRSVRSAEALGRVRLSRSFFMRDFLHSEIANVRGISNLPDDPDLAIAAGRGLCENLLEPLQATFGRVAIRSAYRSCALNAYGNAHQYNCASNARNYARHIWDRRDARGMGAGLLPASLNVYVPTSDAVLQPIRIVRVSMVPCGLRSRKCTK